MIFSPFIPLLPLIIVLVYADTPPQPKTTGTYRSREPAVYGTCITFRGSTMDITGPERSKLPVAAKGSWLYTVSADPSGSYAISPTGENGATWPDNIRLKLAPDAKTITLVLPGESYTCKWLNSQPSVPVQMNIQPVEDDLHGNRYVGDTPTIKWGNEEEMERGRRDFAKLRTLVFKLTSGVSFPRASSLTPFFTMVLLLMGFLSTSLASYPHRGTKSSSSSSDSGIGGSVSTYRSSLGSVGSQLSSYSTFGDDESCPRTSGYYYGTDAHSQCSLIFRQSTAMWSCPSKFGLPEEFEFARVNFDKRSLPDYDYYPLEWYTDKENGVLAGEKDTTVDFDSSCKKILIADAYDFAYFNWRQYEDGPTQRDELRAPRVQGHYIGQGDFDRCRINSVVDKDKKRWCMMKCVDQAKIPTPFEGPLLCWVSPPKRSSSSSRIDLPQFNTLDLKYKSSDIPRNELSVEISGDGLIMNLKDSFPSPRDGVFEWDSTDIIASPPKQPPVPRTSGNYFGEGKYRKCYFQFRNVGKKYAIMRCPRSDDRWSIPDAFLNHTFVYGVKENDGPGRLYSEIELFDKTDGNSPIGSKVDIKYDNSKIKLTFIGYDTPFYFTWSPMSGETGGAITLPFETGYYALPPREYPHMYLRHRHGTIELYCSNLETPCTPIGINGPYATRLLVGWTMTVGDEGKEPEYIEVELSNPSDGQLVLHPKMWVRSQGSGMKIVLGDGKEVLCVWVKSIEFSQKGDRGQKMRQSVRRVKSVIRNRLKIH